MSLVIATVHYNIVFLTQSSSLCAMHETDSTIIKKKYLTLHKHMDSFREGNNPRLIHTNALVCTVYASAHYIHCTGLTEG